MATASVTNTLVTGTTITAAQHNTNYGDLVSFLNSSVVHRDGTKALTANLPAGGNRITGLGAGAAVDDAARIDDTDVYITFSKSGTQVVYTGLHRFYVQKTHKIMEVEISVSTAPTGATLIVDVNKNGTSIWATTPANRPTIATSGFVAAGGAIDTTALADGDFLTVDVDQVGSTVAGEDLTVVIRLRRI
jgi:hypothetical protein